jgi:D-tyrosyl-tRNA(Tyr) deacylase
MRAILQRVTSASVRVKEEIVGSISEGLLVFLGVEKGDGLAEAEAMAKKIANLRIFADLEGRMNLDVVTVGGEVLVVSQFTLAATLARGRRPSFNRAAAPTEARPLVEDVMRLLEEIGLRIAGGRFGAEMEVELVNDGPVTLVLDVRNGRVL